MDDALSTGTPLADLLLEFAVAFSKHPKVVLVLDEDSVCTPAAQLLGQMISGGEAGKTLHNSFIGYLVGKEQDFSEETTQSEYAEALMVAYMTAGGVFKHDKKKPH